MTLLTKQLYFTTSTIIDWVDIFSRPSYRQGAEGSGTSAP